MPDRRFAVPAAALVFVALAAAPARAQYNHFLTGTLGVRERTILY